MARKKRSIEELEAENKYLRKGNLAVSVASILNTLIKWVGITAISYCIFKASEVLSGKNTQAEFKASLVADILSADTLTDALIIIVILALLFGVGGILYGLAERRLRKNKTEYFQERIKKMESMIDPNRSSSRLTTKGETRKEDL